MTASSISFPSSRLALLLQILSVLSAYFLCFAVSLNLSSYLPLRIRTTVIDRKSTRLNSSHSQISYAVFCLNKKTENPDRGMRRGARGHRLLRPCGGALAAAARARTHARAPLPQA